MISTDADIYKMLEHLGLPFSYLPELRDKLTLVSATEGDEYESKIIDCVIALDSLAQARSEASADANAGLIRADVLEWEGGGKRLLGFSQEYDRKRALLANLLDIPLTLIPSGSRQYCSGVLEIEVMH